MKKPKSRLVFMIINSILINVILFWMAYSFNPQFHNTQRPLYVRDFLSKNGHIYLAVLLGLILVFTIVFITYAMKDTHREEVYEQDGRPDFYKKHNIFSAKRIVQYSILGLSIYTIGRNFIRSITIDGAYPAYYIFTTDFLFTLLDMLFMLNIAFTILLIVELIKEIKTTYH